MKTKFLIIVEPDLAIDKQALKVYLVENKLDSIRAAFTDCDASTTFIDREPDALSALTEGMLVAPCLTHAILINAPTIFDNDDDVAVLAVDYRSPLFSDEKKPDILPTKMMQHAVRILNTTAAKVDLFFTLMEDIRRKVMREFAKVMAEKPVYSTDIDLEEEQEARKVYYRLLTTKRDYDDLVSGNDNLPYIRIM